MNETKDVAAIQRLDELETVIERGQKTFYEVGSALAEIRDKELYKLSKGGEFKTFEEYCKKRWEFTGRYARYLLTGKETVDNLKGGTMVPVSERQIRPLTKLETPEEQREAWQKAVETAPNGKVTARHVKNVVDEILFPSSDPMNRTGGNVDRGAPKFFWKFFGRTFSVMAETRGIGMVVSGRKFSIGRLHIQ